MIDEGLSAGAVARRLGVAVTTLRTWHQRYGLGPSCHVPGRHRRYTADDLSRLETMRRLTSRGVAPAEAANWARRPATEIALLRGAGAEPTIPTSPSAPATEPTAPPPGQAEPSAGGRQGGGFAIPLGPATALAARGLARAAMRLDTPAMRELIERSVAEHGVVATWDTVLLPVLVGIGERHASTAALVEVEHLISRTVSEVLGAVPRPGVTGPAPAILLACADEEQHSLPLEALAAALAEAGTPCRSLGARVPPPALRDAVARTGPLAVLVWAQTADCADPTQLTALLNAPGRPLLVAAAGPGWSTVPPEVVVPTSLAEALAVTSTAARSPYGEISPKAP